MVNVPGDRKLRDGTNAARVPVKSFPRCPKTELGRGPGRVLDPSVVIQEAGPILGLEPRDALPSPAGDLMAKNRPRMKPKSAEILKRHPPPGQHKARILCDHRKLSPTERDGGHLDPRR